MSGAGHHLHYYPAGGSGGGDDPRRYPWVMKSMHELDAVVPSVAQGSKRLAEAEARDELWGFPFCKRTSETEKGVHGDRVRVSFYLSRSASRTGPRRRLPPLGPTMYGPAVPQRGVSGATYGTIEFNSLPPQSCNLLLLYVSRASQQSFFVLNSRAASKEIKFIDRSIDRSRSIAWGRLVSRSATESSENNLFLLITTSKQCSSIEFLFVCAFLLDSGHAYA
jgi:hypothetical protein